MVIIVQYEASAFFQFEDEPLRNIRLSWSGKAPDEETAIQQARETADWLAARMGENTWAGSLHVD